MMTRLVARFALAASLTIVTTIAVTVRGLDSQAQAAQPSATPQPKTTLRSTANEAGLLVGAAVFPDGLDIPRYATTLAREFNLLTPENAMKWGAVQPAADRWNFGPADRLVEFAEKHKLKVKGHTLLWHESLPKYVNDQMSADELRAALREHITTLATHYKGRLFAWDVVNEAVADDGTLRKTIFLDKLGDGYLAEAFRLAHEADPEALLIYNDYAAEGRGKKSDGVYRLVKKLVDEGVPIGGVGLQMHISAKDAPKPGDVATNVKRLAALGLKVNISEMDVRIRELQGDRAERLDAQRKVYHDLIAACRPEKNFIAVSFWGFTDRFSWVDGFFGPDDPLPFDEEYQPKPAYEGVFQALSK